VQSGTDFNLGPPRQSFNLLPRDPQEYGVTLSYSF